MNPSPQAIPFERYLAIDAHKRYVMVGGLNAQQEPNSIGSEDRCG